MKENVITKFQEFWGDLKESEKGRLWDILTALRSYDESPELKIDDVIYLKVFTTARIRGVLFLKEILHSALKHSTLKEAKANSNLKEKYNVEKLAKLLINTSSHFQWHIFWAIEALESCGQGEKMKDLTKLKEKFLEIQKKGGKNEFI